MPFQPSSGNHTSNRICESGVGAIVPATRQKGGRLPIAFVVPGGVNEPVVTGSAERIVVFASFCSANRAQPAPGGACAYRDDDIAEAIRTMAAKTGGADFMDRILLVARGCVKGRRLFCIGWAADDIGLNTDHTDDTDLTPIDARWAGRTAQSAAGRMRGREFDERDGMLAALIKSTPFHTARRVRPADLCRSSSICEIREIREIRGYSS